MTLEPHAPGRFPFANRLFPSRSFADAVHAEFSGTAGWAQSSSVVAHILFVGVVIYFLLHPFAHFVNRAPAGTPLLPHSPISYLPPLHPTAIGIPRLGTEGSGGNNDPRPTRHGEFAPLSSMPLAPPNFPQPREHELPVPPAVFDPNAPSEVVAVSKLGLPWMKDDTNSGGPGDGHTFGISGGKTMGDGIQDGSGTGHVSGYANVASMPACRYCPEPQYTDEARSAKLEGRLTARVLVGPDGRAQEIRILKGLGMGLEERTIEAIHTWRFAPALDARRQPVSVWVTIETSFRLY